MRFAQVALAVARKDLQSELRGRELLPALAQHVAFFHPLVHVAVREYGVAREAAVDAAVVAGNRHCRGDYGRLLVRLGVAPKPGAGLASASPSLITRTM